MLNICAKHWDKCFTQIISLKSSKILFDVSAIIIPILKMRKVMFEKLSDLPKFEKPDSIFRSIRL